VSRMSKEELREDPVLEWIQGAIETTQKNSRWILIGVVAVVVIIFGVVMIGNSRRAAHVESARQLLGGQSQYLQGNYAAAETQLQQLLTGGAGGDIAQRARIVLGDALSAQERPAEALDAYESALSGGTAELKAAAHRGKAASLESLARFAEAAAAFRAASEIETGFVNEDLLSLARCSLAAGDAAEAKTVLERLQKIDNPRSIKQAKVAFYLAQAEAALQ